MSKKKIEIRLGKEQLITPGGLATVGALLNKTNLYRSVNKIPIAGKANPRIKNSDVIGAKIGLNAQGKNDYVSVNEFREEAEYYTTILGTSAIPSEEVMRQRLDAISPAITLTLEKSNAELLKKANVIPSPCFGSFVPLDIDVTPFDNSNSKKEGVSWTYKGYMGYAPIMAYVGTEGYGTGAELREGSQHSQKGTGEFLKRVISSAKKVTNQKLLARMDSGFDSKENKGIFLDKNVDFIIKRNLRQEDVSAWLELAKKEATMVKTPREGKTIYIGNTYRYHPDIDFDERIVYEVTLRTIKADGQILLEPDIEVNTFSTTLFDEGDDAISNDEVIWLYHDHATSEQFHSEIKTDMDMERFPSGKFQTNAAILLTGLIAYNILRIMGQESLRKDDAPRKRPVQRIRIKTVIQNLITIAVRVVHHARKVCLSLGRSNAWRHTYKRVHEVLSG